MNALDSLISLAVASYAAPSTPEPGTVLIREQRLVKVERSAKGKIRKASPKAEPIAQPANDAPQAPAKPELNPKMASPKLPAPGTLDARGYTTAIRRAKDRFEAQCAVAAYIGYTMGQDHAAQVFAADQRAKLELRPMDPSKIVTRAEKAQAAASVRGYVAGMPNGERKVFQNLLGRERLAVDTRESLKLAASQPECTAAQREVLLAQALLEEERLVQIRKDLAALIG